MSARRFYSSTTRITDLRSEPYDTVVLDRDQWAGGDYVVGTVTGRPSRLYQVEQDSGRMSEVMPGDEVVGVFGRREATLEAVGSWTQIGKDGRFQAMTGAGLFGKITSVAPYLPALMTLDYAGHVVRDGRKLQMDDFVEASPEGSLEVPVIMLIGTSMSSGKTTTGRIIIHALREMGLKVAAGKFTGAARYRDILSFKDAGADHILDFMDVGLASTVVAPERFRIAMAAMIDRVAALDVDVLVAEAGASPLEPYNGDIAVEVLQPNICLNVLCASDPYAVVGVKNAFGVKPQLVTGPATNTASGIELVRKLTGCTALCLLEPQSLGPLRELLRAALPGGTTGSQ